ncbi:hypothetical protein Csa_023886 [Cucumis sativus]|nr:hypothetical protein Csa_023886 [Cucumis sativus]
MVKGVIFWKSVKQTLMASSTIDVKFIACNEASSHGIWLRNFVTRLQIIVGEDE